MIGKYFLGALAVAVLVVFASISAVAQVSELRVVDSIAPEPRSSCRPWRPTAAPAIGRC